MNILSPATSVYSFAAVIAISIGQQSATAQRTDYPPQIQELIGRYCTDCHQGDEAEAEIDLAQFRSIDQLASQPKLWQRVHRMLVSAQMPPPESEQPSDAERGTLIAWIRDFLSGEAAKRAGDPGPVTLRRLSNHEYDYTIADLIGVDGLHPTAEFPVDGAAGEGFTNTGDALAMSPALVSKYLDAAKRISQHAMLMPDGIRFSKSTTRRDWTDQSLAEIRRFYERYVDNRGKHLDWQRENADAPPAGRIPLRPYIEATLRHRADLQSGKTSTDQIAARTKLSAKYLDRLWTMFSADQDQGFVLNDLRDRWRSAGLQDCDALVAWIETWQSKLWQFHPIGHLGRAGAPKKWMTNRDPLVDHQRLTLQFPQASERDQIPIYLTARNVTGDDATVVWRQPIIQRPGRTPILLRDLQGAQQLLQQQRGEFLAALADYLQAAADVQAGADSRATVQAYSINEPLFDRWLAYLGIGRRQPVVVQGHFAETIRNVGGYNFVSGWGSPSTPSVVANSSDDQVRIPGIARPHSIVVHPSPEIFAAVGWQSPIEGSIEIDAAIADAHPECGNGSEWFLQHRFGGRVTNVQQGEFTAGGEGQVQAKRIEVAKGDLISIIVGPRNGQHSCDLTSVDMTIRGIDGSSVAWNLADQVAGNILRSNPRADAVGNPAVWHFYQGAVAEIGKSNGQDIPPDSLLAKWKATADSAERTTLATRIKELASGRRPQVESADAVLWRQLQQFVGIEAIDDGQIVADQRFAAQPGSAGAPGTDLLTAASSVTEFQVPAELALGGQLSVDVACKSESGQSAVQVSVSLAQQARSGKRSDQPLLVSADPAAKQALESSLQRFRELFPAVLCYTQIVPVDEVVTLQLFYREDDHLRRLMCDPKQIEVLDRLWDELLFIAEEPLAAETALEQIQQFATQDRPDLAVEFEALKTAYRDRADKFRDRLIQQQPKQLESLIEFAARAWRRNLTADEADRLRGSYADFRSADLSHDAAIRLLIARVLVAPAFLYRLERPAAGEQAADVSSHELAVRLSYFLWSSTPDAALRKLADSGQLNDPKTITDQSRRMLADEKVRRLAIHFACQWLHVRDFDQLVEKNEQLYPEFAALRGDLYEEIIRFFTDMFRHDRSILDLIAADHTFVNQRVAAHYGFNKVQGSNWQRIAGVQDRGRGGVLAMAAVLASQSGASRTSPILRGNWVYETLLGERLPRPPAGVPVLPETVPSNKTARQLIQLHSSAPQCAKCHLKIDPYGFALEQYDTLGRTRPDRVDTRTVLPDGQTIEGLSGLRDYLIDRRGDAIVRQFCRKLLGYALGREVQLSDEPLLADMQRRLSAGGYRFSIAVEAIVGSPQFRQIRGQRFAADRLE